MDKDDFLKGSNPLGAGEEEPCNINIADVVFLDILTQGCQTEGPGARPGPWSA